MRAARWTGRRAITVQVVPVPRPRTHEALIRVLWTGVCGSDVEEYLHGPVVIAGEITLGHEIVGTVEAAAEDGSGPSAGTVVVVDVVTGCGRCYWCERHEEGLCAELSVTGQHVDGGLAEFVVGRADRLIPVPVGVPPVHAALAEPLAVAVRAARKAGALIGRGALIVGGGTVGMLLAQVLKAGGASPVVVVEPATSRRRIIESWGIATAWADTAAERAEAVRGLFPDRGVDIVAECSGRKGMTAEAVRLVRRGGTVILLGVLPEEEKVDVLDVVLGEKVIVGSAAHMWDDDVSVGIEMLAAGLVDVAPMITHREHLSNVSGAFEMLTEQGNTVIKMVIGPDGDGAAEGPGSAGVREGTA
ncbi:zinc-dependent alcohol dehydrogenase [Microbacterium sp. DT81.1]|uniref:zinc-dependent alcohol dehydrogenase n=1 Tax=Microbacterium sp. DT81.1 TaxID=3393413 RepID=UPI003CE8FB3F